MFELFTNFDLTTPDYGWLDEIRSKHEKFVVYIDLKAHKGQKKLLLDRVTSSSERVDLFCSQFISTGPIPTSFRYLVAGKYSFFLKYSSNDTWRSNCGDIEIELMTKDYLDIMNEIKNKTTSIQKPLYAIDFVEKDGTFYALDFNEAPQINGTGIEEIIPVQDLAFSIMSAIVKQ